ncbi:MAG: hypothetical protein MN733_28640, partial [Nitrososphaera sp.]|nr:hypothetical protein [Nitrososphaera sp.]
ALRLRRIMNRYRVTYSYSGQVTEWVEAETEEDAAACPKALERADESIGANLLISDIVVRKE